MQRKVITTADGSKTIQIEDWNEQYHSIHGAIQEANYVYIKQGLQFYVEHFIEQRKTPSDVISVLEIGFGTGLNALLTRLKAEALKYKIDYVGVEAFPIANEELEQLNYTSELNINSEILASLHRSNWEDAHRISDFFQITKQQKFFKDISEENAYNVIYFDAFGPRVQPDLWTEAIFELMFKALKPNGVLTTYSAKGSVRRALLAIGFEVVRLDGPPGKRHMLRAIKR